MPIGGVSKDRPESFDKLRTGKGGHGVPPLHGFDKESAPLNFTLLKKAF